MKIRKSHILGFISVLTIVAVLAAVQYYHFRGVKDSLERLVEQRTKGQYKLDLGKTSYDFIRLDFILRNAHIHRIDTLKKTKIYSVDLPFVRINLGSLESYFSFGQINVKEFVVDEPIIVLHKEKLEKKQLQLSGELSNLLNIVKEILDTFNIYSFKIVKGSFSLNNQSQYVKIGLIDFLAKEWNVRRLTNESQISIDVGGQTVALPGHRFSFSQIEYSYLKRQLMVSDFAYRHDDATNHGKLQLRGEKLIVYHIDWDELSNAERYKLKKIELISPDLKGSFPAMKKNAKSTAEFSKMIYSTIGELEIDSVTVRNARVHLAYKQSEDSTSVSFEDATFNVTNFKLLNNTELFEVGEVRFNLNQTKLIVGNKFVLRFDSLFFNHHLDRRLYVEGVTLSKRNSSRPFLSSRQVLLNHFDALVFLMEKKIKAESLELTGVEVNLSPEQLAARSSSPSANIDIDLRRFKLSGATVNYADEQVRAVAEGVNVQVRAIRAHGGKKPSFDFDQLDLALLRVNQEKKNAEATLRSVVLRRNEFTARQVKLKQSEEITAVLDGVAVKLDTFALKVPEHIPYARVHKLNVSASLHSSDNNHNNKAFNLDRLIIDTLSLHLTQKDKRINLNALNFSVDSIQSASSIPWKHIRTDIEQVNFENNDWKVSTRNAHVNSETHSIVNQLEVVKKDSTVLLHADNVKISPFDHRQSLSRIKIDNPRGQLHQKDFLAKGTMDSVVVSELRWTEEEKMKSLQVYHPVMQTNLSGRQQAGHKPLQLTLPKQVGDVIVHKGKLSIQSNKPPVFVYGIDMQWAKGEKPLLSLDSVNTVTEKNKLTIKGFVLKPDQISITSLSILPRQSFEEYSTTGFERDLLKFNFGNMKAKGFNLDSLLKGDRVRLSDAEIGSFQIDVMKDKRLPDAPFKVKNLIARQINALHVKLDVPQVKFNNGAVSINQISDKTNEMGTLVLNNINGEIKNVHTPLSLENKFQLNANVQVFGQGMIKVDYVIEAIDQFKLDVTAEHIDFATFNRIVKPLQSIRFKSGRLRKLMIHAIGNDSIASGNALINYQDLRIEVLNAEKTNFRNEIMSVIANELIKNKRRDTIAELTQERDKGKAEFGYWFRIIFRGASAAARHGKKQK